MSTVMHLPVIAGVEIETDEQGRFNLNALHRASGLGESKKPSEWLRTQMAKDLIAEVESQSGNSHFGAISTIRGGIAPGTFAHELIAISYAGWISPKFQLLVNRTFRDYLTGRLNPTVPQIPQTYPEALRAAAEYAEEAERQREKVQQLLPKARALDRIAATDDSVCLTVAAKDLQVPPRKLIHFLAGRKWIYRRAGGKSWVAYQTAIQAGWLEHKFYDAPRPDGSIKHTEQVMVTTKGIARLAQMLEVEHV